jgi:beta-glucosidase
MASAFSLSCATLTPQQGLKATVTLKNTGSWDRYETVQLYLHDQVASVVQPAKKLIDFKKVFVPAQTTLKVTFDLNYRQLAFFNNQGKKVFETGKFDLFVGPNSQELLKTSFTFMQ